MNCYIEQIGIIKKDDSKRIVPLQPGLNVITGNSKTGKSALIEIVDYCLGSKTFNIPRGEVSKFGYIYYVVLTFPEKYMIIGRKTFNEGGNVKAYVAIEPKEFLLTSINNYYFEQKEPSLLKVAQQTIEQHLGLAVLDISESGNISPAEKRKASVREMISFLFQHQNLIANKHALFYRFDDYYKRLATIDSFPVFAGWVNDEYFSLKRELDGLEKQLRKQEIDYKKKQEIIKEIENEVRGYFRNYYKLVSTPFDDRKSLSELIAMRAQLPDYSSTTFISQDILGRYNLLKSDREKKSAELLSVTKGIKDLEETERYANEFQVGLKKLDVKSVLPNDKKVYHCLTCGKISDEVTTEIIELNTARSNLEKELQVLSSYSVSYVKDIDNLKQSQSKIRKEIQQLSSQILEIEETIEMVKEDSKISDTVIYAKAQIDLRIDLLEKEKNIRIDDDSDNLRYRITEIRNEIKAYNLETRFKEAETFLSGNMNKIAEKLDFEEELKPISLQFDLDTFSLFHNDEKLSRVGLNEMGSGANWLACHLSLFLSFLHYFAKEEKSSVPSILFLDQPSQVYFPKQFGESDEKDNDIKQVEKVYSAIIEEVADIRTATGFSPQVIVTDHADNLDLGKFDFDEYVIKRWTPNEDKALI